jgi:large repetitive protein
MRKKSLSVLAVVIFIVAVIVSCSKENAMPADPCASKTLALDAVLTATSGGSTTNGAINATASGSTGFTYKVGNGAFQASGTFSNLPAATYIITAKDIDGCTVSKSFIVTASACPTIDITAVAVNTSAPAATDGSLTATATGSTGFTYSKDGTTFQATGVFSSLTAGSYNITAKDVNGCTGTKTFIVTSAACPAITVTGVAVNTTGPAAANGSVTATATGGVAPYTYSSNGGAFQSSNIFSNLAVGAYTIVAKDANGCLGTSGAINVASAACPTFTINTAVVGPDKCAGNTGSVTITATGGTGFTYNMNNGTYQSSNVFGSLAAGNYTFGVKDANGCVGTKATAVAIGAAGPKFGTVRALLAANCAIPGCHSGAAPQNGINFADDCTIVANSDRIKARAVDNNPSVMPPTGALSASDKQKIVDWVNAGGQYSN